MHCKPGKTTRAYCLKCNVRGEITGYKSPMVNMRCPKCGIEWRTISAICEHCREPSGNPYLTDCPKCKNIPRKGKENGKSRDYRQESREIGALL